MKRWTIPKVGERAVNDVEVFMTVSLYAITVLVWGSTWLAIYFQLGDVPVTVSIFYRFGLAALILLPLMWLAGKLQKTDRSDHLYMVLQGGCLFSFNFICFYTATQYVTSGLVAVVFSLATVFNAVNNRFFWGEHIPMRVLVAGGLGTCGLVLLFLPELEGHGGSGSISVDTLKGLALSVVGTYSFSLGNMISKRHSLKGIKPLTTNAYAMTYGTLILAVILLLTAQPLVIDVRSQYLGALFYLSIFGSIVGFTTYLTLVARLGANKAAYATVMFPVVALILSSWFEDYHWQMSSFIGLGLTMVGNIVINGGLKNHRGLVLSNKTPT
ncbi:DMT family transporter [Alkalimarinus alittae]|uniref:DMT family transporter n=1 Tax=Alkalimarinus alittae TaxID=2961619 RepID=A0ABY6MZQ9_9ALTE|nr:DMT family transporter [Alkalimarinus alittae]UZE95330.1 DMT family transporter [Alkalimarinus alittae]